MRRTGFAVIAFLLTLAAAGTCQEQNAVADEIKRADLDFCAATAAKGLDGWVSYFAENAYIGQTDPPVRGRQAIRQHYEPLFAHKGLEFKWAPERAEVFAAGTLGYTSGRYSMAFVNDKGVRVERTGSYLTVWERQKDNSWKVIADFGSADPAGKQKLTGPPVGASPRCERQSYFPAGCADSPVSSSASAGAA